LRPTLRPTGHGRWEGDSIGASPRISRNCELRHMEYISRRFCKLLSTPLFEKLRITTYVVPFAVLGLAPSPVKGTMTAMDRRLPPDVGHWWRPSACCSASPLSSDRRNAQSAAAISGVTLRFSMPFASHRGAAALLPAVTRRSSQAENCSASTSKHFDGRRSPEPLLGWPSRRATARPGEVGKRSPSGHFLGD
jgi:hypothetical protein